MQDVSLLVDTMYEYQKIHDAEMERQQKIEDERDAEENAIPAENNANANE